VSEHEPIVVLVSAGSALNAETIARALVDQRLAACVNVLPGMRSIYRWQGRVAEDSEWLLVIKTERSHFAAVESCVRSLHTYEVAEVIALEIVEGSKPYLDWLLAQTRG
jgi:periplasmic divalent cation tolerance protein